MVCCIAAAFVFGLIVKTLQTLFRRGSSTTGVHPTPVRRVETASDRVDQPPVEPGDSERADERTPVGSGV